MERFNQDLEQHQFCYLTTTGRSSGQPHRIEIWFTIIDGSLWVNSGGGRRSDWVKNLIANPTLDVEIGGAHWSAIATVRQDAVGHPARERLAGRYQHWQPGQALSEWATNSLLIEIEAVDGHR